MFELLEFRKLLSVSLAGTRLNIVGTTYADNIEVKRVNTGIRVTTNGVVNGTYTGVQSLNITSLAGADTINSRSVPFPTTVYGGSGNDTITTGDSHDFVDAGSGSDVVHGNGGFNLLTYQDRHDQVWGVLNTQPLSSSFGAPYVGARTNGIVQVGTDFGPEVIPIVYETDTFDDFHQIIGGYGNDYLFTRVKAAPGATLADYKGFAFATVLVGGPGADHLEVNGYKTIAEESTGSFRALLYGGTGNDELVYTGFSDSELYGQRDNDTLIVGAADNIWINSADGGEGTDLQTVRVYSDMMSIYGGQLAPGFENAELNNLVTEFHGNELNNNIEVFGGSGDVFGGAGNDKITLIGSSSEYRSVYGEAGNDTLVGSAIHDNLYGGTGDDLLDGNEGNDSLYGEDGKDQLYGEVGNDSLYGGAGSDILSGYDGADLLIGSDGNDTLNGGKGSDLMDGGNGNDSFYARDGLVDSLFGGSGTDSAQIDYLTILFPPAKLPLDVLNSIEVQLA